MKYVIAVISCVILLFILGEAGYFYFIECFHERIEWKKDALVVSSQYKTDSKQYYFGFPEARLEKFDNALKRKEKVREVVKYEDSTDYYRLFAKPVNMHLFIMEKGDTTNKYSIYITGSFNGICSAQGARERMMLMLRQIEFDVRP